MPPPGWIGFRTGVQFMGRRRDYQARLFPPGHQAANKRSERFLLGIPAGCRPVAGLCVDAG
ncbi:MAG: hypothetical protein HQL90_10505 [Magnetococcales bacterium]|nr:hypothetical protein [Magnetococcales bacterium]